MLGMDARIIHSSGDGAVSVVTELPDADSADGWTWIDVTVGPDDVDDLVAMTNGLDFDAVAVRDAVDDLDFPKFDDFGHHLLVILHGVRDDRVETYEVDCFMTERYLVTVHTVSSPSLDAVWTQLQESPPIARGGVDQLLARIADVLTRRLLAVVDAFDDVADVLIKEALTADARLLPELTAVRSDLSSVRRVVHPQRETLDLLRRSSSDLIGEAGRRRFSDAFDVASRTAQSLERARTGLAEILDAYRGAEARKATDVTMVLTIYAAIMLPLSLIAGFFGMNFVNIPGFDSEWGWIMVSTIMGVIAALSLGVFVAAGWIRRPSGRKAGATLGRGLIEAARAPAQVAGAVYEISTMPLRATVRRPRSPTHGSGQPGEQDLSP
jgi:magnesium transporter